jgi:hypothetical protein
METALMAHGFWRRFFAKERPQRLECAETEICSARHPESDRIFKRLACLMRKLPETRQAVWCLKSVFLAVSQGERRVGCVFESLRPGYGQWTDTLVAHQDVVSGRVWLSLESWREYRGRLSAWFKGRLEERTRKNWLAGLARLAANNPGDCHGL